MRPVPVILDALPTATAAATLLLVVPYAIFAVGLPLAWDAPWLIAGFAFLVGGKVASAWDLPSRKQRLVELGTWASSFLAYLLLAFFVPFPRLGIEERSIRIPGRDKLEDRTPSSP